MLTVSDLAIARAGRVLFHDLSFSVGLGDRMGILGPNGCGKSSLFAAITGALEPERGTIGRPRDWGVAHAGQDTPRGSESALAFVLGGDERLQRTRKALAAAESSADGEAQGHLHEELASLDGYAAEARAGELLHGLAFAPDDAERPVDAFSGGWRARLGLARALFAGAEVLLLDEPTNHLDLPTIDWLADWLARFPGLVLCISHDRHFLDRIATRILWIDRPAPRFFHGNLSVAEERRAQLLAVEARQRRGNLRQAQHLHRFVERFRAKASKARQAQSRLKMLARLEISAPLAEYAGYRFRFPDPRRVDSPLLTLDHADLGYDGDPVLADVHLSILPGDRIGVLGANGAGKSTLMKALAGRLPASGRHAGRHLAVGYFAQHQLDQLDAAATPLQHLQRIDADASDQELRDFLGGFGFHGEHAVEPIAPRSGGERARLALALLAWQRPNLLLLDEPTNHLDLEMRDALAIALQTFTGAVVLVSHDRAFLESLSDRYLRVADGRVRSADRVALAEPAPGAERGEAVKSRPEERRQRRQQAAAQRERLRPLRRKVQALEAAMERVAGELDTLRERLADPALYSDEQKDSVADLSARSGALEQELAGLEAHWLEAQEALESAEQASAAGSEVS